MISSCFSKFLRHSNVSFGTKLFRADPSVANPARRLVILPNVSARTFRSNSYRKFAFSQQTFRQFPGAGRYQRFANTAGISILKRWASRSTFYYEVGALGGVAAVAYIANLEEVPISGRKRFNVVSRDTEAQLGQQQYQQTLQQFRGQILPTSDRRVQQVHRVLRRLIPASGLQDENWEIHVIESPEQPNAFVIPGGKVFVFTGILPIAETDDGLATVLSHEISHNIAHHAAEGMSRGFILLGAIWVLAAFFNVPDFASQMLLNLGFEAPRSRQQESEADEIGLYIMSDACFDPRAAVDFWHRMQKAEEGRGVPPQFLSTHPSSHNREGQIRELFVNYPIQASLPQLGSTDYLPAFPEPWKDTKHRGVAPLEIRSDLFVTRFPDCHKLNESKTPITVAARMAIFDVYRSSLHRNTSFTVNQRSSSDAP